MSVTVTSKNLFKKTIKRIKTKEQINFEAILHRHASSGVSALAAATPVDSGETASAWGYTIEYKNGVYYLTFTNSVMAGNVPLVLLIQYGHGTRGGGYVQGIDFINPALKPIFERINRDVLNEVNK